MPYKILLPFDGTHAGIPAGWARKTECDGKYIKASTSDIGSAGGSATHIHAGASHTHTYSSNSHTHATGTIGNATNIVASDAQHQDAPPQDVSTSSHTHSSQTSGAFGSSSISSDGFNASTAANEYSRYHLIFIEGYATELLPADSIVMRDSVDARLNSAHFDALDGKYMKGAATGASAGSATSVTTHSHTQSHAHTLTHNHAAVSSGNGGGTLGGKDVGSTSPGNHAHTVTFTQHQESSTNTDSLAVATADLAFRELHYWKVSSLSSLQAGDIALSVDSGIPTGWEDLAYNDIYIKGKTSGGALSTGGANTHTHSNLSHSHAGTSHAHTWSTDAVGGSNAYRNGGSTAIVGSHSHSGTSGAGTNASTSAGEVSFSTVNHEPAYINVRFIKATAAAISGGASFLFNFI